MTYYQTLIFYFAIFLVSSLLAYAYNRELSQPLKKIVLFLLFAVLVIPSALRYDIGTDYDMYAHFYDKIALGGGVDKEIGYIFLMKIFIWLGCGFEVFIAFVSALTCFFVLLVFVQLPPKFAHVYVVLFVAIAYFLSFSSIRQSLAVVIVNYALFMFFSKGSIKHFYFYMVLAMSFHLSASFVFVVFLLRKIPVSYLFLMISIVVCIVASSFLSIGQRLITQLPDWFRYSHYMESVFNRPADIGSGLGVVFYVFFSFLPLLFARSMTQKDATMRFWFLCLFAFAISTIFSAEIQIFIRVKEAFSMTIVYAFCLFFDKLEDRGVKGILTFFTVAFFVSTMFVNVPRAYSNVPGGWGIIPYVSIFSK